MSREPHWREWSETFGSRNRDELRFPANRLPARLLVRDDYASQWLVPSTVNTGHQLCRSGKSLTDPYVRYGNYIVPGNVPDQPRLWQSPSVGDLIVASLPFSPSPFSSIRSSCFPFVFNHLRCFIAALPPRPSLSGDLGLLFPAVPR